MSSEDRTNDKAFDDTCRFIIKLGEKDFQQRLVRDVALVRQQLELIEESRSAQNFCSCASLSNFGSLFLLRSFDTGEHLSFATTHS